MRLPVFLLACAIEVRIASYHYFLASSLLSSLLLGSLLLHCYFTATTHSLTTTCCHLLEYLAQLLRYTYCDLLLLTT